MQESKTGLRARIAIILVAAALLLVAPTFESHAQTLVFDDVFTRANSASLGGGWVEAESGASTIRIESNRAQMDLDVGPGNGTDFVHAVNVQNSGPFSGSAFTPQGLTIRTFAVSTYKDGGFTSPHGVGLANAANSDSDHVMFYVQGEGDGLLDGYLKGPTIGTVACGSNIGASDGVGYNELRVVIDDQGDGTTHLEGWFGENGSNLTMRCSEEINTSALLSTAKVKIGNPGADGDTGNGSSRTGDVLFNSVTVWDDDLDDDGAANASDVCPNDADPGQEDADSDGVGDACNNADDLDGDEWADGLDNCPNDANAGQEDADSDDAGDVCDNDPDPTLFSDNFDRADNAGLGASWVEAEVDASKISISENFALLDLEYGVVAGVDLVHAVTAQSFDPAALRVRVSVRETPLSGGFTIGYGVGLADPNDDDVDIVSFWLRGQGDGLFDAQLDRPNPTDTGSVQDFEADVAASDGVDFNELTLQVSSDRSLVTALLNGDKIFSGALDPADIPAAVTVKIGNPGPDGHAGSGSARLGDVEYDLVRVIDADTDMDDDGMSDDFEVANGFDPQDADEDSNGTIDGQDDEDVDGLGNAAEELAGTDPNDDDSDDDGLFDGGEIGTGRFADQQVIGTLGDQAYDVFAADVDGDGDIDVLSASWNDDTIAWYENTDGNGTFGGQQVISTSADGPWSVFAADLDLDGDTDVLSASSNDDTIAWYENIDGAGTFGGQQVITNLADQARSVVAADVDGDLDMDVLSASLVDNRIAWYENTDGAGTFGVQQTITTLALEATSVFAADVDGDGDIDALSSSQADDRIAWYENTDGDGTFGGQQTITTLADGARSVHAADLDGDGDLDVLSASSGDDEVAWYENTDGEGTFVGQQVISTEGDGVLRVFAADLDGDGHLDVLAASENDDEIASYGNLAGTGMFGGQQLISTLADGPRAATAADVDGDGDLDVLSASLLDDKVAWYPQINVADPLDPDTDGDGQLDGAEVLGGSNPNNANATLVDFGSAAALNTNAASDSEEDTSPEIVTDNVNWVAVWRSEEDLGGTLGTDGDILFARSTDSGATWSAPAALNTNAATDTGDDREPQLTYSASTWVAVWSSSDPLGAGLGTDFDVLYSRSLDDGVTWSAPAALNTNASTDTGDDTEPQIASDGGNNHWITVWTTTDPMGVLSLETDKDIVFSHTHNFGTNWPAPAIVDSKAATDSGDDSHPEIEDDEGNLNWVVVWQSDDDLGATIGTDEDILFAQTIDYGATWTPTAALNHLAATDTGDDGNPRIATFGFGDWITTWHSTDDQGGTIGTDLDILFSLSTNAGVSWAPAAPVNSGAATDTGIDRDPQLVEGLGGNWVLVWSTTDTLGLPIGSDYDIAFARSVNAGLIWTAAEPLNSNAATDSGDDTLPQIVVNNLGYWVADWFTVDDLGATIGTDGDILFATGYGPDRDGDGLVDAVEFVNNTAPDVVDTDEDGLDDGVEYTFGTNGNDADTDGDGDCDGPGTGGGVCTAGDNCPFRANSDQANSDNQPAGDVCQCGDVSDEGGINATDYLRLQEYIVGRTASGPFVVNRCDVNDDGLCNLADLTTLQQQVLERPVTIADRCFGYYIPF